MYRNLRVAAILPCYNEEKLIAKTVNSLPDFVDMIIAVDDCSKDKTWEIIQGLAKKNKRVVPIHLDPNEGIGGAYIHGFNKALKDKADLIVTMAGDAQCNPDYIKTMVNTLLDEKLDYVKANRFVHLETLKQMPTYRRIGNTVITILTKFSSGYYSIFDSLNGYGVFRRKTLEKLPFEHLGRRYDYEITLLVALSIMGARIRDEPVPAIYADEVSTIPVFKSTMRALRMVWEGFWRRIYYKYVVVNFHPIALFLFSGLFLCALGFGFGLYLAAARILNGTTPSSGTVMLSVLPLILGFQLLLTTIVMDMSNEGKN
ncbi:MAG TPA: glycosyltransferase family 2 protein [Nevskiaceae bacterium]|nr:glycosyltransferase family 2 protein [Nevskiaceae bacterium]